MKNEPDTHEAYVSLEAMEGVATRPAAPGATGLFRFLPSGVLLQSLYPGVLATLTIGATATWLSDHYKAPVMLFSLLIGMAFHFLYEDSPCRAGIDFVARSVLRTGVALLGARITIEQIAALGIVPVATVIVSVATTIAFGVLFGGRLGLGRYFGVLSAGAVAICGASAALAIASVLPAHEEKERDTILVVVAITALSTAAMVLYPMLVAPLGFDHADAGVFLGGTIHDVAQVVGAGYTVSVQTGDIATYVKLLRVAMLLPTVVIVLFAFAGREKSERLSLRRVLPLFLFGFVILMLANSVHLLNATVTGAASDLSRWCLVSAIAALGTKTSFGDLVRVGWKPIALMAAETAWIFGLVVLAVKVAM